MAKVVRERNGLCQLAVEAERLGDSAGNLRRFERMGQPGAVVIALVIDENLGFVLETAKGGRMDHAVTVALEDGAHRMLRLGHAASAAVAGKHRKGRERARFDFLEIQPGSQHIPRHIRSFG